MEMELASPNEKEKMQMRQYQAQTAPLAPQEKGMGFQANYHGTSRYNKAGNKTKLGGRQKLFGEGLV